MDYLMKDSDYNSEEGSVVSQFYIHEREALEDLPV